MDEPPRRRRRPPPPKETRSVPLLAVFALVVVAGFAIGALISLISHRDGQVATSLSSAVKATAAPSDALVPASTPTPEPTLAPTAAPVATAAPKPSATRSPRATPAPTDTPAPRVTPAPSDTPAPAKAATVEPRVAVAPPATARPASPPATPKAAPPQGAPAETADSEFARQSAAVVRAYLSALARGDDAAAQSALDAPSGSRAAQLSEKEFAGPDMRISSVEAHGTSDSARVDVDVQTPKGAYFAQFFVKKSPGGSALIVNHDFIKP